MALWCQDLHAVRLPRGDTPTPVTFVYPYYENAGFFATQLERWRHYPADLAASLSIVVVDDGSPTAPAAAVLDAQASRPARLRLFRIDVDTRWNWLAARNIGAHHADPGWLLLTDMDHVVPEATLRTIVDGRPDPGRVYAFSREEHTGVTITPHSASFLLTRDLFWRVGGYDETLSGYYGTDGDFRRRLAVHAEIVVLPDVLVRHEFVGDSSTTRYQRKQPADAAVRGLIAARRPGWVPKVLSFPYREVSQ